MQTIHASLESILEFGSTKNANSNDTANSSNWAKTYNRFANTTKPKTSSRYYTLS